MSAVNLFQKAIITIRNVLRGDSITGMDSMRHICIYIVSRYMTIERAKTIGLPMEYAWENMIRLLDQREGSYQLYNIFRLNDDSNSFMHHLDRLFGTFDFTFSISSPEIHSRIMTIMNDVDMDMTDCEIDILGWVYEQHLRTGASAARDLGQFFTNRAVCKYMVDLCNPRIKEDGTLETVCDPTMGTGGFLTTVIHHYNNIFESHIDWREHINAVHGCDSDSKVAAIARMNVFMETKGARAENLMMRNSLYDGLPLEQYDVIVANPPFGLCGIDYNKVCDSVKNLKITGVKSEPLFLQLIMTSLAPNGRAAVIMPGAFLDNPGPQFVSTRKKLVEDFHFTHIIELRGNFFTNTTIPTFILFFANDEYSTGSVTVMRVTRDALSNNIREETIDVIDRSDIEQNNYSLDLRCYTAQSIMLEPVTPEQIAISARMFKLEDVCYLMSNASISPQLFTPEGLAVIKQKNISSGKLVLSEKQDYVPRDITLKYIRPLPGDVIISTAYDCGRCARVDAHGWIATSHICIARARDTSQLSPAYLFWYLYSGGFYEMMQYAQHGIGVKGIRCSDINNAPIYVPTLEEQNAIISELANISSRFDAICSQIATFTRDMEHLPGLARKLLNPLIDDGVTLEQQSCMRSQRRVFPLV